MSPTHIQAAKNLTLTNTTQDTFPLLHIPISSWIGDPLQCPKPINTFRIMFQNVNSIGSSETSQNFATILTEQLATATDILGVTEHCVNTSYRDLICNIQRHLRSSIPEKTKLLLHSSTFHNDSPYLPGGTGLSIVGRTVGRILPKFQGGDLMGRWSYTSLQRTRQPPLTIFSVYQVNKRPTNAIGSTVWHQQRLQLDAAGRPNLHPRHAFIDDLILLVKQFQELSHDIIIGGDFNETAEASHSGLLKLMTSTGLLDPWSRCFSSHPPFNTYSRGSQRIDTVLCSPDLLPQIRTLSYAPFNWFTNSDHRAIVIDISSVSLFQELDDTSKLSVQQRAIRSNDTHRALMYVDQCYKHLDSNNAILQITKLESFQATPEDVEAFDKLMTQATASAENACRRRRPEFYSNKLNSLRIRVAIAHGHLNQLRHHQRSNIDGFQARLQRANATITFYDNLKDAYHEYKTLRLELQKSIKTCRELREEELSSRIHAQHEKGSPAYITRLKNLKKGEATRRAWTTIKFLKTQSGAAQPLNRIDIPASWPLPTSPQLHVHQLEDPSTCTNWRSVTSPNEIEAYLRLRNQRHFGQADGTPFTQNPLRNDINGSADTPMCHDILRGNFKIDSIESIPQCKVFLDACTAASELDLIPYQISAAEFEQKIKAWRETTTTSPSGRHLGHYKVLFSKLPPSPETLPIVHSTFLEKQKFIRRAILAVINFCLHTGHSLRRWQTVVNTMIFKETGNFKIHRLRVIHIYEADFNLILAVKWRQLIHMAERSGTINEGLFGGRPGREAQSLVFLEELKYDLSFLTRRTLFHFDNDATSCYDRIIVSLASLVNRKYGLHRKVVAVHATTLQQARFHLRSATGISEECYVHSLKFPIYGSGQGSGNSPAIWLFISSILCDVHQQLSYGASFTSPDSAERVTLSMVSFVDDSTGTYNDFRPQEELDYADMTSHMQEDAQRWNDLLWCTGGKLELSKCSFHVLRFEFKPNGTPVPLSAPPVVPIAVFDQVLQKSISITAKSSSEAHRTLGHYKAPCERNDHTQLLAIQAKAQQHSLLIATGTLSRHGARLAYFGVYLPSLAYVLPQCRFASTTLDKAERKTVSIILAKTGFNRCTPRPIRYAPSTYAGCGFIPWRVLQAEGQLCLFLKHWRTNTLVSKTLRIATAWAQWQSGLSTSLLYDVQTPLPHLEARWMKSFRDGLHQAGMKIHLNNPYIMPSERLNDVYIMEWAVTESALSPSSVCILNYCRIFLHVTTISELFDESGLRILPHMYECRRPNWFNCNQYMPLQIRPSLHQIKKIWKPFCDRWIAKVVVDQSHSFGIWTSLSSSSRPFRASYVDHTKVPPEFYKWNFTSYWRMETLTTAHASWLLLRFQSPTQWLPLPTSTPIYLIPSGIFQKRMTFRYRCPTPTLPSVLLTTPSPVHTHNTHNPHLTSRRASYTCLSLSAYIHSLSAWESAILRYVRTLCPPQGLLQHMDNLYHSNDQMYAIVQHWFQDNVATFGWFLFTKKGDVLAEAYGPSMGPPSRSRADAWGILSLLQFMIHLPKSLNYKSPLPALIVLHRNQRLIRLLKTRETYSSVYCNATLEPDWDILEQTHFTQKALAMHIQWRSLMLFKATHDPATFPSEFDLAQKICDLKQCTKEFSERLNTRDDFSPFLPASLCMAISQSGTIHQNYRRAYREASLVPDLKAFLRSKHDWDITTEQDIEWQWFQKSVGLYRHASANHLTKLIYDQLPTPARIQQHSHRDKPKSVCPHCTALAQETFLHIMLCDHPDAINFRIQLPREITTICSYYEATPIFISTLVEAIEFAFGKPYRPSPLRQPQVSALFDRQAKIGWTNLLKGFFSKSWSCFRTPSECQVTKLRCTYDQLVAKVMISLWTAQTDLWKSYQDHRHTTPSSLSNGLSDKHLELLRDVKYLFSLQTQVPVYHHQHYFPSDQHGFLSQSTTTQLRQYIHNYGQAIESSVRLAQDRSIVYTRPLCSYRGFTRSGTTLPGRPSNQRTIDASQASTIPQQVSQRSQQTISSYFCLPSTLATRDPAIPPYSRITPSLPTPEQQSKYRTTTQQRLPTYTSRFTFPQSETVRQDADLAALSFPTSSLFHNTTDAHLPASNWSKPRNSKVPIHPKHFRRRPEAADVATLHHGFPQTY